MRKIKLLVCALLVLVLMFAMSSCMDANTLNNYLGMLGLGTHTCVDANKDTLCDTCGGYVAPAACTNHVDNNNDGVCDNAGCGAAVLMEMTDLVFKDRSYTYDGKPKTIEVKGAPEDAEINYSIKNTQTNAGKYKITATVSAEGYNDCEVTATLTIRQLTVNLNWGTDVGPFPSSGRIPTFNYTLEGVLEGETVEVEFDFGDCDFTVMGDFEVVATSKNANYKINTSGGANKLEFTVGANSHTINFETGVDGKTVKPQEVEDGDTATSPSVFNMCY